MKKKFLKITGITLLILLAIIILVPLFLQGKIEEIIKTKVNNSINATLDFEDADLSLLKSFPYANVGLSELSLVNKAPFEGDTLFASSQIELSMSIKELFKSADEPIVIKTLNIDGAKLHIKADANAKYNTGTPEHEPPTASACTQRVRAKLQWRRIQNNALGLPSTHAWPVENYTRTGLQYIENRR